MKPIELLLMKLLNCSRLDLYLNNISLKNLSHNQKAVLGEMLTLYFEGRPIQYILGDTEFMGLEFKVREGVFIPRPETEILAEETINIVKLLNCQTVKLLDIGTGSGNIAVSLAKYFLNVEITAVEVSDIALEVAKENAKIHDVYGKIKFLKSDLFSNISILHPKFDIIVSNPPYIPRDEIDNLSVQVNFEPLSALDGGGDGLDFYRRIIKDAPRFLKKQGYLIFEMGDSQAKEIEEIFEASPQFKIINKIKDYNSIDRVMVAQHG